ncbi:MAG: Hpt domain-containing protein [Gemmatimonadales bacterium]
MRPIAPVRILAAGLLVVLGGCRDLSSPGDDELLGRRGGGAARCAEPVPDAQIPLPIAPASQRVDLVVPTFSNPTSVTNPLFPISQLHSAILLGTSDGERLRVETTLLPGTRTIDLGDRKVETLVSQYVAYLNGRILEVALDFYAQAEGGAAWYFGEDVFNYEAGVIANTDGTWIACKNGPAAMIMPANPQVGNVYRPENAFPIVFEEVTVKAIGLTLDGPRGLVTGGILVEELHLDATTEEKLFAPGYGEFSTGSGKDLEAIALAVPTDALPGPVPAQLVTIVSAADALFEAAGEDDWATAGTHLASITAAWDSYRAGGVPAALGEQLSTALKELSQGVHGKKAEAARQGALDVALAALDFELRYLPPATIDLRRFGLRLAQILVDADADDAAGVTGDVATLEWILQRFAHTLKGADLTRIRQQLGLLKEAAKDGDLDEAAEVAEELRELVAGLP